MALPSRRSPRLDLHDYREAGTYFVTICTRDWRCIFGGVDNGEMALSPIGRIADAEWRRTLELRPYVEADVHIVMPNHVHLLFGLWTTADCHSRDRACPVRGRLKPSATPTDRARPVPTTASPADSVSAIIGGYKAAVTRLARRHGLWPDTLLWQARFHDRIVRDQREQDAIRDYILDNPRRWQQDRFWR